MNVFWPAGLVAAIALVCGRTAIAAPSPVASDYVAPSITVPYARHRPTLDGVIRDAEWRDAVSLSALQTTDHAVSPRQTRFFLMWDADYLYVAMHSPLRPGERLIQALRETDKDVDAVLDDSYEIWIDVGTHSPDGQPVFFQYLGNFAGARFDVMQEPAAGNSRPNWTAHWNPRNHLTADGLAWEMTMAIPRKTIYLEQPFHDGMAFSALLTRNYKRPWDQDSISGSGSFSVRETYARFVLSKTAPAVHVLAVADPTKQTFGLSLSASAREATTLHYAFASDSGVRKEGDIAVTPGVEAFVPAMLDLDSPGDGNFRITVKAANVGRPLFDWSARRKWGDLSALTTAIHDTGDQVDLTLGYNPARDYLRVSGDFIDYDARASIARYRVDVRDHGGKVLAAQDLKLDKLSYVRGLLRLPNLPAGNYVARLTTFAADGKAMFTRESKFVKKDRASFPWWNTPFGDIEKVIAPWTPVRYADGRIDTWGREMQIGAAGLPSHLVTQGEAVLAAPAYLEGESAAGKAFRAEGVGLTTMAAADHRVVVAVGSRLGGMTVKSVVTAEFDGMYRVDLTVDPGQKGADLRALTVVLPIKNEFADYLQACGDGIRYGFDDRFLPTNKTGRLWDSRAVDGQPMVVGSFIPYVWIGNTTGGLCFFADSDEGWTPNDATPAIEVRRKSGASTDLVLHLISARTRLNGPRKISFALQATPVKRLQSGWRMDSWWTNDSFQDWAQVESVGHTGNMGLIFSSIPFPLDPAKSKEMVAARHRTTNASIFGVDKYQANAVPYFEHINMGAQFAPELNYFGDEWRTSVSRGLSYGKTLQDYMIWNLAHWVQSSDIDGFYVDNVFPIADDNIEAGRGYHLPDGRVQPTYQMFDTRRYFLRMRAAFAEQGKSGKIVLHMTNHLIAPWAGAADIALDGEHHVIYPEMGKDFMDFWSPERLRMDYPAPLGTAVNFLQEYQGIWDPVVLKKAMRAYTGMLLLNDVLMSANANSQNQEAWRARDRFGVEADEVRFHGYWEPDSGFGSATAGVSLAGWTRPDGVSGTSKLLLAVVNRGEAVTASVRVNAARLGLPSAGHWRVRDAESLESIATDGQGNLTVPVGRHDYRQVLIEAGP